jgi:glycosyltransferase involved in cell wall biosynthesis
MENADASLVAPLRGDVVIEPDLSVIMPAFNEQATIAHSIGRVLAQPYVREVIVVDDGSTDATLECLRALDDPRIRVIEHRVNRGKGAALRTGFGEALGPFVAVQDADLEYDPADLAKLLGPLRDGRADVVFGSRFIGSSEHRVLYFWHSVGNRVLTTLSNMATNINLTDMETCYKVFRVEVIQSLDLKEDRFGFEPEVTAKVAARGCRIYEVGISYSGRTYAEGKKINWRDGVRAVYAIGKYSILAKRENRVRRAMDPRTDR